jgi:hypothetical protein
MTRISIIAFLFISYLNYSQKKVDITFLYTKPIAKDLEVNLLKFYITKIELLKNDKVIYREKNSFHLIDFEASDSFYLALEKFPKKDFDKIQFKLGIDSATNVSGVMGGDLDPTKGMYWTWQSGYINFKLEGKYSKLKTRDHAFQFHIGGYKNPDYPIQKVILDITQSKVININFDVNQLLKSIDLITTHTLMSPSSEAVNFSILASKCFHIQ